MAAPSSLRQLRGLALPALKGVGGYFSSRPPNDVAWSNLIIAVFTPLGSRPFNRSFGSPLQDLIFQQNDGNLDATIEQIIKETVATWTKNVIVQGVAIQHRDDVISIKITFMKASDNTVYTSKPVSIDLSNIVNFLATSNT